MTILDGGAHTLRIDLFFDKIIAYRKTFTRSVIDPAFRKSFSGYSSLGEIPPIRPQLRTLGRALMFHGVGLTSVDVMIDCNGHPWVIELNTCSVGRQASWGRWPDLYIDGYVEGIRRWVGRGCPGRCSREIGIVESDLSQRSGGREGPHVA